MPQYPDTSKTLIEKIRTGDEVSWEEFYDQYEGVIRGIGEKAGLTPSDCDDLVQDVMARFFRYAKKFRYEPGISRFRTYFHAIVRSRLARIMEGKTDSEQEDADDVTLDISPDERLDRIFQEKWRDAVFQDALRQLAGQVDEKNYLAFTMTALDQVSVPETAEFLHVSKNHVYIARNRCLAALKKIVSAYNAEDPELHLPGEFDHV